MPVGHAAGDRASAEAVDALCHVAGQDDGSDGAARNGILDAFEQAKSVQIDRGLCYAAPGAGFCLRPTAAVRARCACLCAVALWERHESLF